MNGQSEQNDVLHDFTKRLERLGIAYMLTGSMALAHYAMPRTTADIHIVIEMSSDDISRFIKEFEPDYYVPHGRVRDAVLRNRTFNILDQRTIIKIDCVVRKNDEFQSLAFSRRRSVDYAGYFDVWLISKEDLIFIGIKLGEKHRVRNADARCRRHSAQRLRRELRRRMGAKARRRNVAG